MGPLHALRGLGWLRVHRPSVVPLAPAALACHVPFSAARWPCCNKAHSMAQIINKIRDTSLAIGLIGPGAVGKAVLEHLRVQVRGGPACSAGL